MGGIVRLSKPFGDALLLFDTLGRLLIRREIKPRVIVGKCALVGTIFTALVL